MANRGHNVKKSSKNVSSKSAAFAWQLQEPDKKRFIAPYRGSRG